MSDFLRFSTKILWFQSLILMENWFFHGFSMVFPAQSCDFPAHLAPSSVASSECGDASDADSLGRTEVWWAVDLMRTISVGWFLGFFWHTKILYEHIWTLGFLTYQKTIYEQFMNLNIHCRLNMIYIYIYIIWYPILYEIIWTVGFLFYN